MTWVKGQSGNPKGRRPSGQAAADVFRASASRTADGKSLLLTIVDKLVDTAALGDYDSAKIVLDRLYGRVMEQIQLIGDEQQWDLSKLSEKELLLLQSLIKKVEPEDNGTDQPG